MTKHLIVVCSDGKVGVDIHVPDEDAEVITTWFAQKRADEVLQVQADNSTVCLQKRHVVRIEVFPS